MPSNTLDAITVVNSFQHRTLPKGIVAYFLNPIWNDDFVSFRAPKKGEFANFLHATGQSLIFKSGVRKSIKADNPNASSENNIAQLATRNKSSRTDNFDSVSDCCPSQTLATTERGILKFQDCISDPNTTSFSILRIGRLSNLLDCLWNGPMIRVSFIPDNSNTSRSGSYHPINHSVENWRIQIQELKYQRDLPVIDLQIIGEDYSPWEWSPSRPKFRQALVV